MKHGHLCMQMSPRRLKVVEQCNRLSILQSHFTQHANDALYQHAGRLLLVESMSFVSTQLQPPRPIRHLDLATTAFTVSTDMGNCMRKPEVETRSSIRKQTRRNAETTDKKSESTLLPELPIISTVEAKLCLPDEEEEEIVERQDHLEAPPIRATSPFQSISKCRQYSPLLSLSQPLRSVGPSTIETLPVQKACLTQQSPKDAESDSKSSSNSSLQLGVQDPFADFSSNAGIDHEISMARVATERPDHWIPGWQHFPDLSDHHQDSRIEEIQIQLDTLKYEFDKHRIEGRRTSVVREEELKVLRRLVNGLCARCDVVEKRVNQSDWDLSTADRTTIFAPRELFRIAEEV